MPKSFDALVIGAGIVGAACARELALAGFHVGVCEAAGYPGGGATAAGMGHIAVMDDSEPQFALTAFSQRLWAELSPELPRSAEYLNCGSLWIAADEDEYDEVKRKFLFYSRRGIPVEMLDGNQLAVAEPCLRPGLAGALRLPDDSVCYPPCVAKFLMEQALRMGGEALFDSRIDSVSETGGRLEDGCHVKAGIVVIACGTASTAFVPELEIQPRKGHLVITDRYPGFLRHQLIELGYLKSAHSLRTDSVAFNAQPRQTGQLLIGSSRQFGTNDPAIEQHILSRMLGRAIDFIPSLTDLLTIRAWTGLRAATPDKLPLIGLAPGKRNIYIAAGHEGLGISTSLGTARLLVDQILRRRSDISPEPYMPSRSYAHHG